MHALVRRTGSERKPMTDPRELNLPVLQQVQAEPVRIARRQPRRWFSSSGK
jgi:hypothetical protein